MTFYWILQKNILEFFGTEKVSGAFFFHSLVAGIASAQKITFKKKRASDGGYFKSSEMHISELLKYSHATSLSS